ncbi:hypothetical protein GO755_04980 [Spirosoma sp. HMF4905]|uniref:Uncharacterized protein n=1 Tax=Spirosoma arboris TaxID=2682092 RepID=A0A7K1S6Z9_9BACT|nr:hypothetical protein [Spirosoma arboris]MVM29378.1 hypothetical protein [Spirosoma arboris]
MNPLAQLVETRSGSALSEVLQEAPRLVESVSDALNESPLISLPSLFGSKAATAPPSAIDSELDEEPYIPLTAEEIKTKAESKAEMWGAIIALCFGFIHRYTAYQKIREGDKQLVRDYEQHVKLTKEIPVYGPDHPYYAARERWNDFEEALEEADEEARLTDAQLTLLRRAIEADLKAKNRRGTLKTGSITETLFEIMIIKAMAPLMQVGMMTVNKMVDKTMR